MLGRIHASEFQEVCALVSVGFIGATTLIKILIWFLAFTSRYEVQQGKINLVLQWYYGGQWYIT